MIFNTTNARIIEVPNDKWFNEVPELREIPNKTIINKTKPGMGATFSEVIAKRNSIIMLPHVSIIKNKQAQYKDKYGTFAVFGDAQDTKLKDILSYICSDIKYKKFLTTPKGLEKIKKVIANLHKVIELDMLYNEYFLLIDECHKLVKDTKYREDMIPPMDDFFLFKNKAMISATALPLSDPRFNIQGFQRILVKPIHSTALISFKERPRKLWLERGSIKSLKPVHPFKKDISLFQVNSITTGLKDYIEKNPSDHYCIFFNSIKGIRSIIDDLEIIKESVIYCSSEGKKDLILKNSDYTVRDKFLIEDGKKLSKYTFFTSSFYTGLDIKLCFKPAIIILTDCYQAIYSLVDPYTDVIQIIGRFRENMYKSVIHINNYTQYTLPMTDELINKRVDASKHAYNAVNALRNTPIDSETDSIYKELMASHYPYSSFIDINQKYSSFKEDNYRDFNRISRYYSQPYMLIKAYSDSGLYNASYEKQQYDKDKLIYLKRMPGKYSKENVRMVSEALEELESLKGTFLYPYYREDLNRMFPTAVLAFDRFGFQEISRSRFSITKLRDSIALHDKQEKKVRLPIQLIYNHFFPGRAYTCDEIKKKLQKIYDMLDLDIKAKATDIHQYFIAIYVNKYLGGKSNRALHLTDYVVGMNPIYTRH